MMKIAYIIVLAMAIWFIIDYLSKNKESFIEGNSNTEYDPCQVTLNENCGKIPGIEKNMEKIKADSKTITDNLDKYRKIMNGNEEQVVKFLEEFD